MGRNTTGAISVNECLFLKVNFYAKNIRNDYFSFAGSTSWNTGASISFVLSKDEAGLFLELSYWKTENEEKESFNYRVRIVSVLSNLGKGNVYYFICPISGNRCKILYMGYGSKYFKCRKAYQHRIYYPCQLSSRLNLSNDIYWRVERQLETLYPKHPKTHYKGEFTRPQKRIKKLEAKMDYHDNMRMSIFSQNILKIMGRKGQFLK
jgi:hypothetical protein